MKSLVLGKRPSRKKVAFFNPKEMFSFGEQGVWYDPSDFSTMFQDAAGTTPVTAVEQPVGLLLDKRGSSISYNPATMTISSYDGGGATTIVRAGANLTFTSAASGDGIRFNAFTAADSYSVIEFIASGSGSLLVYAGGTPLAVTLTGTPTAYRAATQPNTTSFTIFRSNSAGLSASITINSVYAIRGNHATQATSASRPVLSARVNLLTYSEQFDNAAWTKTTTTVTQNSAIAPDGTTTADTITATSNFGRVEQAVTYVAASYTFSIYAKKTLASAVFGFAFSNLGATDEASVNLNTGIVASQGANVSSAIVSSAGDYWRIVSVSTRTAGAAGVRIFSGYPTNIDAIIWGADLRPTNQTTLLPAYQRIAAATDYDTTGFPYYLKFDGTDDSMATGTITPGTDKVQVFAGLRRLNDLASIFAEFSLNANGYAGSFYVVPYTSSTYAFGSRGSASISLLTTPGNYPAPRTNILTNTGDISASNMEIRVNGTQVASSSVSQGTGNYLAYPLYIGSRAGSSDLFNGNLYSLIVRFGANLSTNEIKQMETWVSKKTGVSL